VRDGYTYQSYEKGEMSNLRRTLAPNNLLVVFLKTKGGEGAKESRKTSPLNGQRSPITREGLHQLLGPLHYGEKI